MNWLDYNGFLREEKGNFNLWFWAIALEAENEKNFFVVLLLSPFIALFMPLSIISFPVRYDMAKKALKKISDHAYDIEDTESDIKLIRSKQGKLGLVRWHGYISISNDLYLEPKYDSIIQHGDAVIVVKDGMYGLYNIAKKTWAFPMKYKRIAHDKANVFLLTEQNGLTEKRNLLGDRIYS